MSTTGEIRSRVKRAYGQAFAKPAGCCGAAPDRSYARTLGYALEETSAVDDIVAGSSLGCGNPLAFSAVQAGETVLDLGSGAGFDLLIAAEHVGAAGRVIGVDMTPEMITTAQANIAAAPHRNIEVRQGTIEDLPVKDATVDWVISNCVINLSPEKEKVYGEIYRVLRPGGRFSISDLVVDDLPAALRKDPRLYTACIAGAVSEADYVAGLKAAGLIGIEVNKRIEFTAQLLTSLDLETLITDAGAGTCCSGPAPVAIDLEPQAKQLHVRVWSLNFVGRKPARAA